MNLFTMLLIKWAMIIGISKGLKKYMEHLENAK
jgi:hypothetical protein